MALFLRQNTWEPLPIQIFVFELALVTTFAKQQLFEDMEIHSGPQHFTSRAPVHAVLEDFLCKQKISGVVCTSFSKTFDKQIQ